MRHTSQCCRAIAVLTLALTSASVFADSAWLSALTPEVVAEGRKLFMHEWMPNDPLARGDGIGPLFNATSCAECHNQGGVGGGADNTHNVKIFEVIATRADPHFRSGQVHAQSLWREEKETVEHLRKIFPRVVGGFVGAARPGQPSKPLDPVVLHDANSTALFGAGLLDLIPEKAIWNWPTKAPAEIWIKLESPPPVKETPRFPDIPPGRPRVLADGRIGKFGWKSQFSTLEEFVASACANEIGLSTPSHPQATPISHIIFTPSSNVADLFAIRRPSDLDEKQFSSLVAFVAALPRPIETMPETNDAHRAALRGKIVFENIGCAACHIPTLGNVGGIYSDLLLHSIANAPGIENVSPALHRAVITQTFAPQAVPGVIVTRARRTHRIPKRDDLPAILDADPTPGQSYAATAMLQLDLPLPIEHPRATEWRTPPLWGVADSPPYLHDGSAPTLKAAIEAHDGDARGVRDRYRTLPNADRAALLAFLNTLRAPGYVQQAAAKRKPKEQFLDVAFP